MPKCMLLWSLWILYGELWTIWCLTMQRTSISAEMLLIQSAQIFQPVWKCWSLQTAACEKVPDSKFRWPTLAQRGSCRLHVGPTWAQRALLSGVPLNQDHPAVVAAQCVSAEHVCCHDNCKWRMGWWMIDWWLIDYNDWLIDWLIDWLSIWKFELSSACVCK